MFLMICGFWMLLFIENQKSEYTSFAYFTSFLTRRLRKQFKGFNGGADYKQLLDEVFVISRIIKVEVGVISRSWRLRLITLTETLIILDITKTESNNCFIVHVHWMKRKWKSYFCFLADSKQHKSRELNMITLRNHAPRLYITRLPMTLSVLDMITV